MAALTLDTVALRTLAKRINELIEVNEKDLGGGNGIVQNDFIATGGNYFGSVAYIRALKDTLNLCQEVENDLLRGKD